MKNYGLSKYIFICRFCGIASVGSLSSALFLTLSTKLSRFVDHVYDAVQYLDKVHEFSIPPIAIELGETFVTLNGGTLGNRSFKVRFDSYFKPAGGTIDR